MYDGDSDPYRNLMGFTCINMVCCGLGPSPGLYIG
jgi:hypothetical protein